MYSACVGELKIRNAYTLGVVLDRLACARACESRVMTSRKLETG